MTRFFEDGEAEKRALFEPLRVTALELMPSSTGHDARTMVPTPCEDSSEKVPPESSVLSLMLARPNPLALLSPDTISSGEKPTPRSLTASSNLPSFFFSER